MEFRPGTGVQPSAGRAFHPGGVELHFDVEKGVITRAQAFTDSLNPAPLEALAGGCKAASIGRINYRKRAKR